MQLVFTQARREEKNRKAKSSAAEKQAKRPLSAAMGVDFLCNFHRLDDFFWCFFKTELDGVTIFCLDEKGPSRRVKVL